MVQKKADDQSMSSSPISASKKDEPAKPLRPIDLIIAKAKAQQAQTNDKLQPLLSKPKTRLGNDDDDDVRPAAAASARKFTGAQKMQFGQFRKAKIVEEDEDDQSKELDKSEEKPKVQRRRKRSSEDDDEDE